MRAATFAKQTGRTVSFALAAFRQAFAAGRDLSDPDNVLIAAAACELHPRAVLKAAGDRCGEGRAEGGDRGAPATSACGECRASLVGEEVFWGDDRLEQGTAAAAQAA